jgi:hypothetical protein
MNLKDTLDRLFDKDLGLTHEQRHILIGIIGDFAEHEFNAGFETAKNLK